MKTFVVLAVSVMLSILFCPMVMAAPPDPIPDGVQIAQPDPSLPKELSGFLGKWEGTGVSPDGHTNWTFFLIIEKINEKEARTHLWHNGNIGLAKGWRRFNSKVSKEGDIYKLLFKGHYSRVELALKGEDLDWSAMGGCPNCFPRWARFTRATKW